MTRPSVILMGSKPGAVVALSILLDRGWDVREVVVSTSNLHPWIEGQTLAEAARRAGIGVGLQSTLRAQSPVDFVISYMYRNRVQAHTRALARRAALNFHPAPLPEYGGWAFYNVAILEGATQYGCTCHHMDEAFDAGPIVSLRRFAIDPARETACSLEAQAQREMLRLFIDFCDAAESGGSLPSFPQDPRRARYLSRAQFDALKEIPHGSDPETIQRYARAFWYPPYKGAYMRIGFQDIEVVPESAKSDLAALMHASDLEDLRAVAREACVAGMPA